MLKTVPQDWREFLEILLSKQVKFMIVGGVAANAYGQPRYTQDIDIFISREKENADAMLESLKSFGFGALKITCDDFMKENYVIQLGMPPNRIDILTGIKPLDFTKAWNNRSTILLDGLELPILRIEDLIKSKIEAGRPKDLADVDILKKILDKQS